MQIVIKNPNESVKRFIDNNLVIDNPEYSKKARLGLWLGKTPEKLFLYEKHGQDYVIPYGHIEQIMALQSAEDIILPEFNSNVTLKGSYSIPNLYDYQKSAVDVMQRHLTGILQAPAGSGKTQMGLELAFRLKLKTLWLTHTLDLVKQSYDRASQFVDKSLLGTIKEGKVEIGEFITFATVQTLSKMNLSKYSNMFDCVIVDECHRVSGSPTKFTMFSKVLETLNYRRVYGLSATVHRADGTLNATKAFLGNVCYKIDADSVADKILKVGIKTVYTSWKMTDNCLNTDGTLCFSKMLTEIGKDEIRNKFIISLLEPKEPTLFLSERIEQLEQLISFLTPEQKRLSAFISGKTKKEERDSIFSDFRSGNKKYLFATYQLAKEGLDIPPLTRLFMCSPVKDFAVVTQSIGRIARSFQGKTETICYDFVDYDRYLQNCYKKRVAIYKKNNCYFI